MEKNTVAEKFWRITKHEIQMKIVDGHCVFYNEGCTVHRGRPWRCAQWPLHPSILDDESNFRIIANSCPGINSDIPYEEFCEIMRKLMGSGVISC